MYLSTSSIEIECALGRLAILADQSTATGRLLLPVTSRTFCRFAGRVLCGPTCSALPLPKAAGARVVGSLGTCMQALQSVNAV